MLPDPYEILGVPPGADFAEVKKAFREQAKREHPDTRDGGGAGSDERMRLLLLAYKTLSKTLAGWESRLKEKKKYEWLRPAKPLTPFDFRAFLVEEAEAGDGEAQARLVLFELFHLRSDSAIALWRKYGGLNFPLRDYFERGDWMDFAYTLAEELDKAGAVYEAFILLVEVLKSEDEEPYFRHFAEDARQYLKELARLKLRAALDDEAWAQCLEKLLTLNYPLYDQARWRGTIKRLRMRTGKS